MNRTWLKGPREAAGFTIDPEPIRSALAACRPTGLSANIAARNRDLPDEQAQADRIARLLDAGNLDGLSALLNMRLRETIVAAADGKALDDLAGFLRTVVRTCAHDDPRLNPGAGAHPERRHQHQGESKGWPFVALVDQCCGLDGMALIQPLAGTQPRLDESSVRAVRSGGVSQTSVDGRVYEWVAAFADLVAFDGDKPAPGDTPAFADFCRDVNLMLWDLNYDHKHVFGLCERAGCEPDEVKQQLLQRLPDLRLFDCGDPGPSHAGTSSVLRVRSDKLETWFTAHLKAIAERRKTLAATLTQATQPAPSTTKPEPAKMNEPHGPSTNTYVIVNPGSGNLNVATGHAQAHQHNLSTPQAELLPLLERLLAETGTGEPRYADLRRACREVQGVLEENAPLPPPAKTRLRQAIDALPTADKAVGVAAKVAELIAKIPGLGA